MTSLDLLHRARIQRDQFGQTFLGQSFAQPFPTHVRPEPFQLSRLSGIQWHALLGRQGERI